MSAIASQTEGMVVIDNASDPQEQVFLRQKSEVLDFELIENDENLGVAEALNKGVLWARRKGYRWVILFDQDSKITESFVHQMFVTWESHPDRDRVAAIHPRYIDPKTGIEPMVLRADDAGPIMSNTSGALMPTWIFDRIGGFAAEYFIDCVDFEYCLRIRSAGYLIADSKEAVLFHEAGDAEQKTSFLGFSFRPTHHNATRRYYISRNRIALYRKYFLVFPRWMLRSMNVSLRETVKCFMGERDRPRKFRNFLLGTWDGFTGRMGKRENL